MAENSEDQEIQGEDPDETTEANPAIEGTDAGIEVQTGHPNEEEETTNDIEEELILPLQEEQRTPNQHNLQNAARILAANEEVAKMLNHQDKQVDINLKLIYGVAILLILLVWIIFVICFSNKQLEPDSEKIRHISDTVFITLLTTATANIIALPTIILKYLFSHHDK